MTYGEQVIKLPAGAILRIQTPEPVPEPQPEPGLCQSTSLWIACCAHGAQLDAAHRTVAAWSKVGESMQLAILPSKLSVLADIVKANPDITIYPTIKLIDYITRLDSIEDWARIAEAVAEAQRITGHNGIGFDCESASRPMIEGEEEFIPSRFVEGLNQLPAGTFKWYHGTTNYREKAERWCKVLNIIHKVFPDIEFTGHSMGVPYHVAHPEAMEMRRKRHSAIMSRIPLEMVHIDNFDSRFWSTEHLPKLQELAVAHWGRLNMIIQLGWSTAPAHVELLAPMLKVCKSI